MLFQGQILIGTGRAHIKWNAALDQQSSDEQLVECAAAGNSDAMSRLYDRYARLVFSVAYRNLHDRSSAEEVVQEVFWKLWKHARDYRSERGKFSSWLIRVTQNACIDEIRHRRVRPITEPIEDENELGMTGEGNPSEALENVFERARVTKALAQIPPEQRTVIEMAFYEGLTHPEIASRCGDPLGTVKTRLRLGLHKLKGLLAE